MPGVHGQLSEATRVEYEKRSACFKKQYDEQWDDQTQMRLNGTRTLDENLCDNSNITTHRLKTEQFSRH